ncbi:hypothetical protein MIND_00999100 [Mycena indigotica]|uniref:Uncharacterized protein n=1 Tax=Mycena indigotica TaxID=2126181 RepID=A0A8H6SB52_9AGAR|nr:uncharacterized protein MIND_00999100 [Mycena indigotica]KAF7294625.1 hypothetical protein MIND_00999100 [Mycena indigotica]
MPTNAELIQPTPQLEPAPNPPESAPRVLPRHLRPLDYEIAMAQRQKRNEKARKHQAKRREALKQATLEEKKAFGERARIYQARYRFRHREAIQLGEAIRRAEIYCQRYGVAQYQKYVERRERWHKNEPAPPTLPPLPELSMPLFVRPQTEAGSPGDSTTRWNNALLHRIYHTTRLQSS